MLHVSPKVNQFIPGRMDKIKANIKEKQNKSFIVAHQV